ncbi:hypothetical protein ACLKA6_005801 [Drosophila palustris]
MPKVYKQNFRDVWLQNEEFKQWIRKDCTDPTEAYGGMCGNISLRWYSGSILNQRVIDDLVTAVDSRLIPSQCVRLTIFQGDVR